MTAKKTEEEVAASRERSNANLAASQGRLKSATEEQRKETASKGGKARAKKAAEQKSMQKALRKALALGMEKGKQANLEKLASVPEASKANLSMYDAIALRMVVKAAQGDVRAAVYIRDTLGEKPVEHVEAVAAVSAVDEAKLKKFRQILDENPELCERLFDEE